MNEVPPVLSLKRTCPVCEQGSSLVLIVCPGCGHVAFECDEEGSVFPDARRISAEVAVGRDASCSSCGEVRLADFETASEGVILAAGFSLGEFE